MGFSTAGLVCTEDGHVILGEREDGSIEITIVRFMSDCRGICITVLKEHRLDMGNYMDVEYLGEGRRAHSIAL